jgi:hypothetical protein
MTTGASTTSILSSTPRFVARDALTAAAPSVDAVAACASAAEPSMTTVMVTEVDVARGVATVTG